MPVDHVKLLLSTPANQTKLVKEEEVSGHETAIAEKIISMVFSKRDSLELKGGKEGKHEEATDKGNALPTRNDELSDQNSNDSEGVIQRNTCKSVPSTEALFKDCEASVEEINEEIVSPVGLPGLDRMLLDHPVESTQRNADDMTASVEPNFEESGLSDGRLFHDVKEKSNLAITEVNFYLKNTEYVMREFNNGNVPKNNGAVDIVESVHKFEVAPDGKVPFTALEETRDMENFGNVSDKFDGTLPHETFHNIDGCKTKIAQEMDKSVFSASNELICLDVNDGVNDLVHCDDMKTGNLDNQKVRGSMEKVEREKEMTEVSPYENFKDNHGNRGNDFSDASEPFLKDHEYEQTDMVQTRENDFSLDFNDGSAQERGFGSSQQICVQKTIKNDEDALKERALFDDLFCQSSNNLLFGHETRGVSDEPKQELGSSYCTDEMIQYTAEDEASEYNDESQTFSNWEVNLFLGNNEGEVEKSDIVASKSNIVCEGSGDASSMKENVAGELAEEQLDKPKQHLEEPAEIFVGNLAASDLSIQGYDGISEERDRDFTFNEGADYQYNGNAFDDMKSSSPIMQEEVLTKVEKSSNCGHDSLVESRTVLSMYTQEESNANTIVGNGRQIVEAEKCTEFGGTPVESNPIVSEQSGADIEMTIDGGTAIEASQKWQQEANSIWRRNSDAEVEESNDPGAEQLNSNTVKRKFVRTSLIHGTPKKLFMSTDMKENAPSIKREQMGNQTAAKSAIRRRALEDLKNN